MDEKELLEYYYSKADDAFIGETINCPSCQKIIEKKYYQQKFCDTKCKDDYWNKMRYKQKIGRGLRKSTATPVIYDYDNIFLNDGDIINLADELYNSNDPDPIIMKEYKKKENDSYWDELVNNVDNQEDLAYVQECGVCGYLNCKCG